MAACDACGTTILFGGVRDGDQRYCNANCARRGAEMLGADRVPESAVERQAREIHQGNCPKCGGPGPVDVHKSHSVYSFLVMTRWATKPQVCCRGCGRKSQVVGAVSSLALGWWGFPWGLLLTPVQVGKNVGGILGMSGPDPSTPSADLRKIVRLTFVAQQNAGIAAASAQAKGKNA